MAHQLFLFVVLLLVSSQSLAAPAANPAAATGRASDSGWHCEQDAVGAWTCVEDETIRAASNNTPPAPATTPAAADRARDLEQQVEARSDAAARRRAAPAPVAPAPAAPTAPTAPTQVAAASPGAVAGDASASPDPQQDERVGIMNLPDSYYTVQLLALSSRQALEAYAREHNLYELSAARIESAGELRFVLLMGAYPTVDAARNAATLLPQYLQELGPWIRTLSSLKQAMRRGDALAAARG